MKSAKCFDIHDKDITPEIYILLFCDAFVELTGNDTWYRIYPFGNTEWNDWEGWEVYPETEYYKSAEEQFLDRLKRGYKNCYHNEEAMKKLYDNPCTCEYAIKQFKEWLTNNGVTKDDALFVKIWW